MMDSQRIEVGVELGPGTEAGIGRHGKGTEPLGDRGNCGAVVENQKRMGPQTATHVVDGVELALHDRSERFGNRVNLARDAQADGDDAAGQADFANAFLSGEMPVAAVRDVGSGIEAAGVSDGEGEQIGKIVGQRRAGGRVGIAVLKRVLAG